MLSKYLEYRKNKKIVKQEFMKLAASALPVLRECAEKKSDAAQLLKKTLETAKEMDGEAFFGLILKTAADKLDASQTRLMEILQYLVHLSPDELRKILIHSTVETMHGDAEEVE